MIELSGADTELLSLKELDEKECRAAVLRLDKVHPVVSGNKWFKLNYYLGDARKKGAEVLMTFGGAYSNHIIATACAAKEAGFKASIGVIRGERPLQLSPTLLSAISYGMELLFLSREDFKKKEKAMPVQDLLSRLKNCYLIPEGGAGVLGAEGASEILSLTDHRAYSHIMCAIGTGTMYAGLVNASERQQQMIGIPVLKGFNELPEAYAPFIHEPAQKNRQFLYEYHFGGYAKKTPELLAFMNSFYERTGIPTDFVYTGKLLYAFMDLLQKGFFNPGSNILIIHSGGLQGNKSLPEKILHY